MKKIKLTLLFIVCGYVTVEAGEITNEFEIKIKDLILLSKGFEMSNVEYAEVKGVYTKGWDDYVYFTFKSKHSLNELASKSKILKNQEVEDVIMRHRVEDLHLKPNIDNQLLDKQKGIGFNWYRKPRIVSLKLICVKDGPWYDYLGICNFHYLPTNGASPNLLLDEAGRVIESTDM